MRVFDLVVPDRISSGILDVILDIHPEGNEQVKNDGRSQGQKGNIDKIFSDDRGSYAHLLTYCGANTENLPFNKIF